MKKEKIKLFLQQERAYRSEKKLVAYFGGIQSGKTTIGAIKTRAKAFEYRAEDDAFIVTAPDYKTLHQATLPKLMKFLKGAGEYKKQMEQFDIHNGGTIYFRTATNPESIEGITNVRFIWGDEAGQYPRYFYENLEGRAAFRNCQIFLTSTHYAMNWMAELAQQSRRGVRDDVFLVELRSIDNPYFPKDEYERQRKILDPKRFGMKYEGVPGRMEGLVYPDVKFISAKHIPAGSKFYGGIDWGYTDPFVLTVRAVTPEGLHYRVSEFYKTGLIYEEMRAAVKARTSIFNVERWYADPSRPDYIDALNRDGQRVSSSDNDIRLGIDLHTQLIREDRFFIFEEENPNGVDEYQTYHYPQEKELKYDDSSKDQLPVDAKNHGCDADRYVSIALNKIYGTKKKPVHNYQGKEPQSGEERRRWLEKGGSSRLARRRENLS